MMQKKTKSKGKTIRKSGGGSGNCFTIMPFDDVFNEYYEMIYKPAIKKAGLNPRRTDDLYGPGPIIRDIWRFTREAKIIIADLSGRNANVFYELGLAHAIRKPVILVSSSMADVPFDLRHLRVLEYDKGKYNWGELLKYDITAAIIEILQSPTDVIPGPFLQIKSKPESVVITEEQKEIRDLRRDIENIRNEIRDLKPKTYSRMSQSYPSIVANHP